MYKKKAHTGERYRPFEPGILLRIYSAVAITRATTEISLSRMFSEGTRGVFQRITYRITNNGSFVSFRAFVMHLTR